eukprot:2595357-Karenia_brevis.AAC.1
MTGGSANLAGHAIGQRGAYVYLQTNTVQSGNDPNLAIGQDPLPGASSVTRAGPPIGRHIVTWRPC